MQNQDKSAEGNSHLHFNKDCGLRFISELLQRHLRTTLLRNKVSVKGSSGSVFTLTLGKEDCAARLNTRLITERTLCKQVYHSNQGANQEPTQEGNVRKC
ncbi:hypothetical protein NQD34_000993 [Periophthalmus magnuspinnatus]|nr:hypothetical protein NQD34_000993 [Periophthalmus magnuspinnatus]